MKMLLGPHRGDDGGNGSSTNTSSAALAIRRPVSASVSAASSMHRPRATLTRCIEGFISASLRPSINFSVSGVSAQVKATTSACGSKE